MQYAPPISTNIGTILANAGGNAADSYMQGMKQFSKGIGDGISSAGDGIAKGMIKAADIQREDIKTKRVTEAAGLDKANENKMTGDYLDSMAAQYAQTPGLDGQTPLMSPEELVNFSKLSLGGKQGIMSPKQAQFNNMLKNQGAPASPNLNVTLGEGVNIW